MLNENFLNNEGLFNEQVGEITHTVNQFTQKINQLDNSAVGDVAYKRTKEAFNIEALEKHPQFLSVASDMEFFIHHNKLALNAMKTEEHMTQKLGTNAGIMSLDELYSL